MRYIYIMRKTQNAHKRKSKTQKRRHHRKNVTLGYTFRGGCGCGGMKGGFAPSFSGLPDSKFYALNTHNNDPNMMQISSRNLPNMAVGMSSMRGGKRWRRVKKSKTQKLRKTRGGMSAAGLLSQATSLVMGNGLSDNMIANQGGLGGMVTTASVLNGNPNPVTVTQQHVGTLYSGANRPMV
jgi:hypothetical protein